MSLSATLPTHDTGAGLKHQAEVMFRRKRVFACAMPLLILAYLVYAFFAFDVPGLVQRASFENAARLVSDSYSYKTHVTRDNRSGAVEVAIEGERKGTYAPGTGPEWVRFGADTTIDLGGGNIVTYGADDVRYVIPGYGTITARPGAGGVQATFPEGPLPDYVSASRNRVMITTDAGRLTITRNRTEVFKYQTGWELFFFTLDSPYHGVGPVQLVRLAVAGEGPAIWHDFWYNPMWRHGDVAWALFETVLMAFLGTFGAAVVALPLAFLAARNFTPLMIVRQAARRVFDVFRGVDALIWTVVLARAFGPGPMTGALAILLTDTGSFGKMFSEALENVDDRQIEGIRSTGAAPVQRYRFGVIPQITPVLMSQVLYFFESNTRSATVIGAITGGGIGLLLTQAMITQKDWEEVSYYIILVVLLVFAMDSFSGWLRRRLIKGDGGGH
ncbi:phosphonate ABC transporter, permease protein PhnE [Pseudooceanicola sediminis]|uniref:Phosphonate ABC transporter, permease protein PhnE n=1 Tax=Pseudooceanicola sediminis TaxID=2211117 RepID=A0A399IXZ4_9RHOB|nr:phosphonate ABC transporter, permease protein PhnE [Pseudooceanicola sediminis]KAA2312044.1 phosphonate ABC transporter, permease protein PhnE [Puniceibacterium sp. HSS470]RII38053.1 phosphonate ABC transporter, permease protein PhnE [Pseudooceanicola sediminis]|tara:strand:+ start:38574 stop:39905 length:1332 start_codon:yes stop_codon:yes gene_type:complete